MSQPKALRRFLVFMLILLTPALLLALETETPAPQQNESSKSLKPPPSPKVHAPSASSQTPLKQLVVRTQTTMIVEEWAKRKAHVDVYLETKKGGISSITKNAQILAVQPANSNQIDKGDPVTSDVTLLVAEKDIPKLESAQNDGVLFFSLTGTKQ